MVNKEKVEAAIGEYKYFSLSPAHEERMDVWIVSEIGDKSIKFVSNLYNRELGISYTSITDRKKPELLLDEINKLFVYFVKGLETGVFITKEESVRAITQVFTQNKEDKKEEIPIEDNETNS